MSRNSKNAQRIKQARDRKNTKGPAATTPAHGKKFENRSKYNRKDRKGIEAGKKRTRTAEADTPAAE
jgi:hypothetical protein